LKCLRSLCLDLILDLGNPFRAIPNLVVPGRGLLNNTITVDESHFLEEWRFSSSGSKVYVKTRGWYPLGDELWEGSEEVNES
jgi:hypothetical protein